ncbi:ABC transporter substrate-binding protein [Amycolatopsis sp. DSM 110486]|uniref:ABC transporter substrate-binding protein n=1 Tax=Amycolatopsis sp. DSM 110486 TaxID=2865832 RepID=UPI001C69FEEE|nr:ABC transporter substrate-binding protein [Amycolatopsis sp. DSM 110486]QYN21489.1 ABC transporter substrate-binding protein [Amycolatopsis sp. DSM 110486]
MRRRLTRLGMGLAAVAAAATTLTACGTGGGTTGNGTGPITFASGKDLTGAMPQLLAEWNKLHPDQKVTFIELSASPDDQRNSFVQDLQARSGKYDVMWDDVVWTSEFAAHGWLEPLDKAQVGGPDVLPAAVDTATYQGKMYGAPFMTNSALLYYRSDLVPKPPTTWAELQADCAIAKAHDMACYVGQFAQYEGLTVNAAEAITSAGGSFLSPDGSKVTVDSPQARAGLQHLVDMFRSGNIPAAALTYQEQESANAFVTGKAMFLANWPYVYTAASAAGSAVQGKFGMAQLPGPNGPGIASLGGIDLGVSAFSKHKQTAKDFVAWMQSESSQRVLVKVMNQASVLTKLYTDPDLTKASPYLPTLQKAELTAVPRLKTPNYNAVSLAIQKNVYAALQGKVSVDGAVKQLAADLQQAISAA